MLASTPSLGPSSVVGHTDVTRPKPPPWVIQRYWHRLGTRLAFATSATAPHAGHLHTHSEVPITRHIKVRGNRSPYDGDWVYWSTRQGRHPASVHDWPRCSNSNAGAVPCGLFFHHDDRIEIDHINGRPPNARATNLQALHGHCHDAKTREYRDYLPPGMRDKHQDTEERRDGKCHAPFWSSGRRSDPPTRL